MHSTVGISAIATNPGNSLWPSSPNETLVAITTPQRKARTGDKNRLRWKDAKAMALRIINCADTAEVKKWLKALKVHLSLRLTSGWVAVRRDLATKIRIAKVKSVPRAASNIVQLQGYKIGARSRKDCARNFQIVQGYKSSNKPEAEEDFNTTAFKKLVGALDRLVDRIAPPTDFEIVLQGMKDAIASSSWEFLRLALIGREQHKVEAWSRLSPHEQEQLDALIPLPIRLLKAAVKRGAIAAFKEDDEGGIFHVWINADSEAKLVTGTSVAQKFPPNASLH